MLSIVTGVILVLLGVILGVGGIWLAILGGSWAYLVLGIGLTVTGVLLVRRRSIALGVYAALLLGTLAWALWEVGLDRWSLVPRGAFFALVGVWLLVPWINRTLDSTSATTVEKTPRSKWSGPRIGLAAAMVLVLATTLVSITRDGFDVAGQLPAVSASAPADAATVPGASGDDWLAYGGTGYGQRYSSLTDITPETVNKLEPLWTYHTGDMKGPSDPHESTFEVTPLKVGDMLYLCTPHNHVIALDAATGKERWRFDPKVDVGHTSQHLTCRGLAYHDATNAAPSVNVLSVANAADISVAAAGNAGGAPVATTANTAVAACKRRIILPTIDARLFALDATTGQPCAEFGSAGVVKLSANLSNFRTGNYMLTSPPVVTRNLLIVGSSINDNESVQNPSGVIRAFDVHTGRLVWNWDLGNPDPTAVLSPEQHYTPNTPGSWSVSSVDEKLGLVYIPLGNQSPDQLGKNRTPEVERFSSAVVALDVATGKLRWVFQGVHHDLWDRDVPSQPTLIDLTINGATVPALVAPTKQGELFVLDRRTGKPIFPVNELPVAKSRVAGEFVAPTQPSSALSFMPPPLVEKDMWGATPWDQLLCRIEFRSMQYAGPYTPPSTERTLVYPGNLGVFNWGGVAVDPVRQILIGTPARLAFTFQLVPRLAPDTNLVSGPTDEHWNENYGARYAVKIGPFVSPIGVPCQAPPWGAIAGADLRTGKIAWMHRNGTVRDQMPSFLPIPFPMGVASLGGPLVTAGGVAFYSGTLDNYLRAYDVTTGRKLWQGRLPAGGQATPMTYRINGKQVVVVAAGGHGSFGTTLGDAVVAYALK